MASKSSPTVRTYHEIDRRELKIPGSHPTFQPITQVGMTTPMHWGTEPEPMELSQPKTLAEQVAETDIDRVMQLRAEERVEDSEGAEFNENKENIHDALEALLGGTMTLLSARGLLEACDEVILSSNPKVRESQLQAIGRLKDLIAKNRASMVDRDEKARLEKCSEDLAVQLQSLSAQFDLAHQAVQRKNWAELNQTINPETIKIANALWQTLDLVRRRSPDRLVSLAEELKPINPGAANLFKRILIHFVENHNHFTFSQDLMRQLDQRSAQTPQNSFPNALRNAYVNRPANDNVIQFLQKTTGIPAKRFMEVLRAA